MISSVTTKSTRRKASEGEDRRRPRIKNASQ
jgi:hypothetical protein